MKIKPLYLIIVAAAVALGGCNKQSEPAADAAEVKLDSQEAKVSYILGTNVGGQFKSEGITVDTDALLAGITDATNDVPPRMTQEEIIEVLQAFQEEQLAKQEAAFQAAAEANKQEGEKFLADNAAKEGIVTLDSGLQYKIVTEGSGEMPSETDTVQVHYRGTLVDGSEFDSSYRRGEPAEFAVNQVIPGWTEALQLMKEGAKWELFIPPELAYGPGGAGGPIGPNQTLLFEVELLKILPENASEKGAAKE